MVPAEGYAAIYLTNARRACHFAAVVDHHPHAVMPHVHRHRAALLDDLQKTLT